MLLQKKYLRHLQRTFRKLKRMVFERSDVHTLPLPMIGVFLDIKKWRLIRRSRRFEGS